MATNEEILAAFASNAAEIIQLEMLLRKLARAAEHAIGCEECESEVRYLRDVLATVDAFIGSDANK